MVNENSTHFDIDLAPVLIKVCLTVTSMQETVSLSVFLPTKLSSYKITAQLSIRTQSWLFYLALMLKINYIATHLTSSVHAEQGNHIFEVFNDNDIIQCIYYSIFYVDILRGGIVTSVMTLRINNLPYLMSLLLQEFSSLKAINRKQ